MRNIILLVSILYLSACNSGKDKQGATAAKTETTMPVTVAKTEATQPDGKVDPVCEMPYDKAWTDQTIYNGDTMTFCSEVCKKTFLARPKKYLKS